MIRAGAVLLLVACGATEPEVQRAPDVILITLDTTRADAIGAYGASPSPTERLDRLASGGLRFEEAVSVCPLTLPSHASIHTGLYPDRHGVRTNDGFLLGQDHETLAERLGAAGYQTAAFVAAAVLDDGFGLAQGFDHYGDSRLAGPLRSVASRPGQEVSDEALTWMLRADQDRPLFLWAHYYDPHQPLNAPEPYAGQFEDAYLAEVAAMDAAVGQLLDGVKLMRKTEPIVLVVGDHGEGRGDHDEATHGMFVYRSTMQVPMVLHAPGLDAGVVTAPVSQVDIAPTLLALAGLDSVEGVDGVDLGPIWRGEKADRGEVYGEALHGRLAFGLAELRFVQDGQQRYIRAPDAELYDWRNDPGELDNLVPTPKADPLIRALETQMQRPGAHSDPSAPTNPGALAAGALEALGYLEGVAVSDTPWEELPDPKTAREVPRLAEAVLARADGMRPDLAASMLRAFVEEHPGVVATRLRLSITLELAGEREEARSALDPLIEGSSDPRTRARWAELSLQIGEAEAAHAVLADLTAAHPTWSMPISIAAEHERIQGRPADAIARIESSAVRWADDASLQLIRAAASLDVGNPRQALEALEVVASELPTHPDGLRLRARAQAQLGQLDEALATLDTRLRADPTDAEALGLRGLVLFSQGRDGRAELAAAVSAGDPELEVILALADLEGKAGRYPQAEALLDRADALSPGEPQTRAVRAGLLLQQGRFKEAEALSPPE